MNLELVAIARFLTGSSVPASEVPWRLLRTQDLRVIREWTRETMPPESQRRAIRALRVAISSRQAQDADVYDEAPDRPVASVLRPPSRRTASPPSPSKRESRLLLEVCAGDPRPGGARDGAILALMLLAGLRRQEVPTLKRGDLDDGVLKVSRRRAPPRYIWLEGECRDSLEAWLQVRGGLPGAMFLSLTPSGEVRAKGIHPSTINAILARRCRQAGSSPLRPGDLRQGFVRRLKSSSEDARQSSCRYLQIEEGQPAWSLSSLPGV